LSNAGERLGVPTGSTNPQSEIRNPMILGEPPPTQGDLHFRLFGFPVRVHPFFWLVTLLLGLQLEQPVKILIWIIVVFVSILVHELGHAFLQRYYGGRPWITLYSFGGLASCNDCNRAPWPQIIISLAGPVAGFILAGLVIAVVALTGHAIGFALSAHRDLDALMIRNDIASIILQPLVVIDAYFEPYRSAPVNQTVADMLQVNILWGVLNLLPIYPLDGGRITRELFTLWDARSGIIQSLQLSAGAAVLVAAYAVLKSQIFMALMFGFLAFGSFQMLQAYRNRWQ
jgi:Zn-dependent protease